MPKVKEAIDLLVAANHILAHENVVDAFGHVSIRHPEIPNHYFISCSRSPQLVTPDDIMEFDLEGNSVDGSKLRPYAERHIHGAIMEARPEINSVVHNHSYSVIPFGLTGVKLRPAIHVGAGVGEDIGVWDIHDKFGDTDLLVRNMEHGRDLASFLGQSTVVLMRGHGSTVAGQGLKGTVLTAIYLQVSATIQLQAMQLGDIKFLSPRELEKCQEMFFSDLSQDRAWEHYVMCAEEER